jgi:hypothetical protein
MEDARTIRDNPPTDQYQCQYDIENPDRPELVGVAP